MPDSNVFLGMFLLVAMVGAIAFGARRVRRRLLPEWVGADARLAEIIMGVALVVLISELLGAVGAFHRWPFVGLTVGAALVCGALAAATPTPTPATTAASTVKAVPRDLLMWIGLAAMVLVFAQWGAHVVHSYRVGMFDGDTMWYHQSFAARFAQTGSVTRLHFTESDPFVAFFPGNSELIHADAMLLFGSDFLSPALNLLWLGLSFLAGFCLARRSASGWFGVSAVAVVMSLPIVASTQAGTARNDVVGIALFLAALALVVRRDPRPAQLALAGVAAGLALGVKLSLVVPVGLLVLGVVVFVPAARRLRGAVVWLGAVGIAGGFWYLRNALTVHNPLPWVKLGPLHSVASPEGSEYGTSVFRQAGEPGAWSHMFQPGLHTSVGPLWFVVLALVAVAVVPVLVAPADAAARMVAIVAILTIVIYAFTPNSAQSPATPAGRTVFLLNLRYAMPGVVTALTIAAATRLATRWWCISMASVMFAVVLSNQFPRQLQHFSWEWELEPRDVIFGAAATALAGIAVVVAVGALRSGVRRVVAVVVSAVALVGVALLGGGLQHSYQHHRYRDVQPGLPMSVLFPWAAELRHARIGIAGDVFQYPLYGRSLTNHVEFLGGPQSVDDLDPPASCRAWRDELRRERLHYVALVPTVFKIPIAEAERGRRWTASIPGARPVLERDGSIVYRLDEPVTSSGCP